MNNERIKNQPKFKIGESVIVTVESRNEKSGMKFKNDMMGHICEISASGTSEKDTYTYGITIDMPRYYHNGRPPFIRIFEDSIRIMNETPESNGKPGK